VTAIINYLVKSRRLIMNMDPRDRTAAVLLATVILLAAFGTINAQAPDAVPPIVAHADETPFLAENATAMNKMMAGMEIKPSGDVDADFSAMMIPHHQGAIDMAIAELRYGKSEQLRRIAQEIIVDQQQEIAAMRLALGQPLPLSVPAPTQSSPSSQSAVPDIPTDVHAHNHSGMGSTGSMLAPAPMQLK
jgi:Domain of unknown function (DUF305)